MQDVQREAQRKEIKSILKSCTATGVVTPKRVSFMISGGDLSSCAHKGGEMEPQQLVKWHTLRCTPVGGAGYLGEKVQAFRCGGGVAH